MSYICKYYDSAMCNINKLEYNYELEMCNGPAYILGKCLMGDMSCASE